MILWIFAVCLMAVLGLIGYYQGAIRVAFSLARSAPAEFRIYDLAGRRVARRDLDGMSAGPHMVTVPEAAMRSGVFFVRMVAIPESGGRAFTETRSIVLVR